MTRVILRSIRLSLITSNYSCGSVSYVLITSRNEAGDLWSPPRSRCISSVCDYVPTLKIDYRIRASRSSLLLGKVTTSNVGAISTFVSNESRPLLAFLFHDWFLFLIIAVSRDRNVSPSIAQSNLSFRDWHSMGMRAMPGANADLQEVNVCGKKIGSRLRWSRHSLPLFSA